MESVVKPMISIQYQIAYQIISQLYKVGLITQEEFEKIDELNMQSFGNDALELT